MDSLNFFQIFLILIISLTTCVVAYYKWAFMYWTRKGLDSISPTIPFGNFSDIMSGNVDINAHIRKLYSFAKERGVKHVGIYCLSVPVYFPIAPEIAKQILQNDFSYFVNHGMYCNKETDPLSGHLFNLENDEWKTWRHKLSPAFTTSKLKQMFDLSQKCVERLLTVLDSHSQLNTPVEIHEMVGKLNTDIVGSAAFGVECNSLGNPDAEFYKYSKMYFMPGLLLNALNYLQFIVPHSILKFFRVSLTPKSIEKFFLKTVEKIVQYREKNDFYRNDIMHLLLLLKNKGLINEDTSLRDKSSVTENNISLGELAAQCFVFFAAGTETTTSTISFALYELAKKPKYQEQLRQEIKMVLKKHNGNLSYEAIMEMTYLEAVVCETLRKYTPVSALIRTCNQNYTIPGTSIKLEKGTQVWIPIHGIHNDPEYYSDPDKFHPERFSPEGKDSRPPFAFLPFGEGPRICIGMKFGLLNVKLPLVMILENYRIKLNKQTMDPLVFTKTGFTHKVEGGIWLDLEKV